MTKIDISTSLSGAKSRNIGPCIVQQYAKCGESDEGCLPIG